MVTTPNLPLERGKDARLKNDGWSLWPEKSVETLPTETPLPEKGERKFEESEALKEQS